VSSRIRTLKSGKTVLVGEGLNDFLTWAGKRFEISICSLGEQTYVNEVAEAIDPTGANIRGAKYSCRKYFEYSM